MAGLEAIGKIEVFTREIRDADHLYKEAMVFDATLMNFVVIGEVVEKLSSEVQKRYADIPWAQIKSFRNIVAHTYFGVDAEEVWQIIHNHLPAFKSQLQLILEENP